MIAAATKCSTTAAAKQGCWYGGTAFRDGEVFAAAASAVAKPSTSTNNNPVDNPWKPFYQIYTHIAPKYGPMPKAKAPC